MNAAEGSKSGNGLDAAQLERLAMIYATERQDDQNSMTVGMAIVAVAITYMAAVAAYIGSQCSSSSGCHSFPFPWVQYAAPVIPIVLTGFLAMNAATTLLRSDHMLNLEKALETRLPSGGVAPTFHSDSRIISRGEIAGEATPIARLSIKLVAKLPYIAFLLGVVAFIVGVLERVWSCDRFGFGPMGGVALVEP